MAKLSMKKNLSSMQVLKTLKVLLQGNFTMHELIAKLNAQEAEPIFNNSVISKYINTCRYCGIEIPKIHNKYFVTSMPFGLDLTGSDINLLENLQNIVKEGMSAKCAKFFDSFVEKLNRYSNKKITRIEKGNEKAFTELFENAITDKRKVRLMFKNRALLDCIPVMIVENNGKTFFKVNDTKRDRMITADRLSGIEILREKYTGNYTEPAVVFALKGALASRYELRENEYIVSNSKAGELTVSNRGENKEVLFARLLRYDDKCEILHPQIYRDEMAQILNDALKNYGEM